MDLNEVFIKSLKNLFFGIIVLAMLLPLLLSVPVVRENFLSAISMIGISFGDLK